MRVRLSVVLAALIAFAFVAATAFAAGDGTKGDKAGKKKLGEGEKVEIKDVPTAVNDAAKKELPHASFTSAEKLSPKKRGTVYSLVGKDGKYQVSVVINSSGELLRLTKSIESKGKKKSNGS